jgi:hypothetical protein
VNSFLLLRQRAKRHKNQLKIDSLFYYLKACDGSLQPITINAVFKLLNVALLFLFY